MGSAISRSSKPPLLSSSHASPRSIVKAECLRNARRFASPSPATTKPILMAADLSMTPPAPGSYRAIEISQRRSENIASGFIAIPGWPGWSSQSKFAGLMRIGSS
jgi:hypothetical protein